MLTTTHAKTIEYAENLINKAAEAAHRGKCIEKAVSFADKQRVFAEGAPEDLFLLRSPAIYTKMERDIKTYSMIENLLLEEIREKVMEVLKAKAARELSKSFI